MSRQITILVTIFLGALILGSIACFLLYVPAMSIAAVVVVLTGMILMFLLGVHTGARRIRISRDHIHIPVEWTVAAKRRMSSITHPRPL
jgi:hypothetical protein